MTLHVSCHSYFMYFVYSEAISWQEYFSPPHAFRFSPAVIIKSPPGVVQGSASNQPRL